VVHQYFQQLHLQEVVLVVILIVQHKQVEMVVLAAVQVGKQEQVAQVTHPLSLHLKVTMEAMELLLLLIKEVQVVEQLAQEQIYQHHQAIKDNLAG
tara:strand:+ start:394 stop:681 length:288 start_codon:yes stop_codon:yes gene_type:complete